MARRRWALLPHWQRLDDGFETELRLDSPRRWFRVGLFYGPPPGSHMGFWRTRGYGVRGWNYRVQVRPPGPGRWRCLTALAHRGHR